uniref:DUF262 domain-containing protein n=1 Tax=Heterorhabditis bacteriophora TaxID=37862 RepID=A0A1I7XI24_HETBA
MVFFTLKMFHNKSIKRQRKTWKRLLDVFTDDNEEIRDRSNVSLKDMILYFNVIFVPNDELD